MTGKQIRKRGTFLIRIFLLIAFLAVSGFAMIPQKDAGYVGKAHSSQLQERTVREGKTERTDYVNGDGIITNTTDKGYATVIKTAEGSVVREEYFDDEGKPARQSAGHYGLLREYNDLGQNFRTTYLDAAGNRTENSAGVSVAERSFLPNGKIEYEWYDDLKGNPVTNGSYGYGVHQEYNEKGRNIRTVYLDADGKPMDTRAGFAILRRTFYEEGPAAGKVENEYYFDAEGNPAALSVGQYGLHRDYDEQGRNDVLTYLDAEGRPMNGRQGYATVRRTFRSDNSIRTEMYYNAEGQPVSLVHGQYGVLRENGQIVYLDRDGKAMFVLAQYLQTHEAIVMIAGVLLCILSLLAGKKGNLVLLVLYLGFIAYMTLMSREAMYPEARLEPFWAYRNFFASRATRLGILENIWLFVPLGIILCRLRGNPWIVLAGVGVSVCVEILQYLTGLGSAELDDVISNGLGAALGFIAGDVLKTVTAAVHGKGRKNKACNRE